MFPLPTSDPAQSTSRRQLQYADYALWQSQCCSVQGADSHLEWWRLHLASAPPCLEVPLDAPRPVVQRNDSARAVGVSIEPRAAQALRDLCRATSTTLNAGLLALWGAYLSRLSGQREVVLSQPHSLRHDPRLFGTIGYFHAVLPLVSTVQSEHCSAHTIAAMRDEVVQALEHAHVSFHHVVDAVAPARSTSHNPLAQASLVYHERETIAEDEAA